MPQPHLSDPPHPARRTVLALAAGGLATAFAVPQARPAAAQPAAAAARAVIDVDTTRAVPLQPGLIGYNIHITNRAYHFTDRAYRSLVAKLQPRWGRWSAGTANNVFDARTGTMPEERRAQMFDKRNQYFGYDWERRVNAGKNDGYLDLVAYYDTLRETCAVLTVVVNTFTGTPQEAADLARFCAHNNIRVDYWELQNEPYLFAGGADPAPKFVNSASDYLNKVRPFHDAIRAVDPDARTVIAYTPKGDNSWDDALYKVTDPWWDAIVWHTYEAYDPLPDNDIGFEESMRNGNWLTAEFRRRIDANYLARSRLSPTPILQNELDVRVAGPLYNSQYNAVFNAESVLRLTTAPKENIRLLTGAGGIPLWILDAAHDHTDAALDALERRTTVDSELLDHGLYFKTVGVANVIVNEAINNSATRWPATVTGGATVPGLDAGGRAVTVAACFAAGYRGGFGGNAKDYTLVTNKSALPHTVDLRLDGTTLASPVTAVYSASDDPEAGNSATDPDRITARTARYPDGSAITVPPYSVVRLEWARPDAPSVPRTPRITSAEVTSGSAVRLKWWEVPNATSYTIHYGTSPGTYPNTQQASAGSGTEVTGLSAANTYYFTVTATGPGGTTPRSGEVSVIPIPPQTPSQVTAAGRRGGTVTVTWRSVPRATGYVVRYGTSRTSLTEQREAGNRMGADITGLRSGTTYYFTVEAANGAGTGGASPVVTARPGATLAYTPVRLRLSGPATSTTAALAWNPSLVRTFTDHFEESAAADWTAVGGSWTVRDHPDTTRRTKVFAAASGGRAVAAAGDPAWRSASVEAQVEVASYAADGAVGLLARYTDADNHYRFEYRGADQRFALVRVAGGAATTLAEGDHSKAGQPFAAFDPTHMRLVLEVIGSTVTGYANNQAVVTAQDTTHPAGRAGLTAVDQSAFFDKVHVWTDNMTGTDGTYTLYRSDSPHSGYAPIATGLTEPDHTDRTLSAGHTYYYRVSATKAGAESLGTSNILTVVT